MPKSISLTSGLEFASISAGVAHFKKLLEQQEFGKPFTGPEVAHIRAAFDDYCAKTDWPVLSPPASFYPTHERGPGFTTRCYGVTFEDGSKDTFSMPKALRAISR
jgi:hypothetical protein